MTTTKLIGLPLIGLSGVLIVRVLTTRRNFRPHIVKSMLDCPPARELIASGKVETKGRVVELLIQRISVYMEYMETTCEQGGLSVNIKSWRSRADQKEVGSGPEADEERRKTEDLKNLRSTTTEEWKKQRCNGEGRRVPAFIYVARCKLPSVILVCMDCFSQDVVNISAEFEVLVESLAIIDMLQRLSLFIFLEESFMNHSRNMLESKNLHKKKMGLYHIGCHACFHMVFLSWDSVRNRGGNLKEMTNEWKEQRSNTR